MTNRGRCGATPWVLFACLIGWLLASADARAFEDGVSFNGCEGCHSGGSQTVELDLAPSNPAPGDLVDVRLIVRGSGSVLGLYLEVDEGELTPLPGAGLTLSGNGLTHRGEPLVVSGGVGEARFRWQVPDRAGASRFLVSTVVGNGNGRSGGDSAADEELDVVYGCAPATFYPDRDEDGFGVDDQPRLFCEGTSPPLHTLRPGDCNDFNVDIFPGGNDVCNQRDDDCDGTDRRGSRGRGALS